MEKIIVLKKILEHSDVVGQLPCLILGIDGLYTLAILNFLLG